MCLHLTWSEKAIAFYHRKFDGYDIEQYMIMAAVCSIFLPFFCSLTVIALILLYLLWKGRLYSIIRSYPKAYPVYGFCVLTAIVSLIHENYLGAVCALGITVIFIFILFYRSKLTQRLFELIIDACCIISLFCFGWALMEYYNIVQTLDYDFFTFEVADEPMYRVNSTFFNANYYGMMVEFLILMCVYKMLNVKTARRMIFYLITIFCNLLGLYLSGCRTAWISFLFTIPFMFLLNNHKRFFFGTMALFTMFAVALWINPEIFPRGDSLNLYLDTRFEIWQTAIQGIREYPLFGEGPLTYFHSYMRYGGPMTQHAHSLYLDPFMSFGFGGVALLIPYFWDCGKRIWHLYTVHHNVRLFSLIISFILTVMIHGTMDYTIFWVQTALLFFMVFSAFEVVSAPHK